METVATVLLAGATLAIATGLTTALLRPESALDAAITFFVIITAGVAAVTLVAGATGVLTRGAVLGMEAAWALLALALAKSRGHRIRRPRMPRLGALRNHPWAAAIVALAALALAWQILVAVILPPFAFDALTYHLTIAGSWIDAKSIDPSSLSLCCAYYPSNSELLFVWPLLMADGDGIVDLTQFGFVALGALSVAGLVRSAGLPAAASAAAAGLFAATPIVLVQAPTNYADVFVAASALAGLHALVRFAATGAWQRLLVAGLAAGLLLGTKGTGVVWAGVLIAASLAVVVAMARRGNLPRRATLLAGAGCLCACIALGSYWYARNWIEQGNPAYPFAVQPAGVELFDGPFDVDDVLTQPPGGPGDSRPVSIVRSWAADLDFWNQGSYSYEQRLGGLGPLWPWLALPLLAPLAIALVRRRSPVLIAVGAVALVLLVQPYAWWSRFTIPLMGIGALAVVAAIAWAPRAWMRTAVQAFALVLVVAGVALSSYEVDPAARAKSLASPDVVDLITATDEERTIGRLFFPEYRFLEQVPDDATIVVDLRAEEVRFVYPFFRSRLTREVLPSDSGPVPPGAWVVTAAGRPLDLNLAADAGYELAASTGGVHAWRPAPGS